MSIIFEKLFNRAPFDPENDPGNIYYSDLDPEVSREYDAMMVEHGLMTVEEFNETYPDRPFIPEAIYEQRPEDLPDASAERNDSATRD